MSKSRPSNSERGMSLIEVLIAITLFVIIILAALLLYDRSNRVFKTGVEAADTQQNTRVAFDKIATDLRMAGYDYDRDGVPAGSSGGVNWFQQPDEQIEHAGVSSITLRANFDSETSGPENGRETAQETSSGGHFPVVTTGNDEIVTYALESADASKNDDSIFFYADVPDRKSFPGAGGRNENLVTITGVDLSNANPPYTLYRYTLDPGLGAITVVRTPLANNIRSLRFEYFEDPGAARQLTDLSSTPVNITEAVDSTGGVGQFNPNVGTAVPLRAIRAKIQSVRMTLIGMNESFDSSYQDPNEATGVAVFGAPSNITSQNYRKFRLQSIIVPRNYQKSGLKEQETAPPGAPTITRVCIGYCGLAYVEWDSPVVNASQGSPEDYQILYGATSTTVTNIGAIVGIANSGFVTVPDPSATYYFSVKAVNSFGSTPSPTQGVFGPVNATKPSVPDTAAFDPSTNPDGFRISGGGGGQPAPQANQISLEWSMPTTNASGSITCPFGGGSGPATDVREIAGYRISRNAGSASFSQGDPDVDDVATVGTNIPIDPITGRALFIDTTAANCVDYYYKIQQIERCQSPASYNAGSDASLSFSDVSSAILGRAESIIQPKAPTDLVIVTANSSCNNDIVGGDFNCTQIELTWPRVSEDINNTPLTIAEYEVTRRKLNAINQVVESNTVSVSEANDVSWGDNIVWRDTDLSALTRPDPAHKFEYEVRAKGLCTGTPLSGPSPARVYPCTFVGGTVTVDMTNRFEGSGSSSDPWLVQTPSALNINTGAPVKQIRAIVNPGNIVLGDTGVGSFATASFPWPGGLASGQTYQINISIEDMGGCVSSVTRYVEEYAFNCCVVPVTIDSSIRQLDGPSGIEKFRLVNICNSPLQLTTTGGGVETTWERDALTGSGGSDKLTRNFFPTSLPQNPPAGVNTIGGGGDNEGTRIYQPQGGQIASVPVDSTGIADDYYVQFQYSKSFAPTFAPTQNLCIKYRIGGVGALRSCRIYPDVSTSPDSCN